MQPVVHHFLLFFRLLGEIVCRTCPKRFPMEWISHEQLYFVCVCVCLLNLAKIGQRRLYLKMRIH